MHSYLNKTVVITIDFFNDKGRFLEQYQSTGKIITIHNGSVVIGRDGEEDFHLPFEYQALGDAEPGVYTIGLTGKEVSNPDLKAQWTINGIDDKSINEYKRIGFKDTVRN